ncbi:MAG: hypothetical protein EKK55_05975 [Rhodocyclaceae bacterium]|nr:MAG: hypothetical protein EKK55_05975 [Rhodocyclaceae bacterium]
MAENDLATPIDGELLVALAGLWMPAEAAVAYQGISAPTPPTISITPSNGSSVTRTASVQVDVTDDSGALGDVTIWATYADGSTEVIWKGNAFAALFSGSTSALALGTRFTFSCAGFGWPTTAVTISVKAADPSGAQTGVTSVAYTVSNPPAAPTIGGFSPATGGSQTRTASVQVDVTDAEGASALVLVQITAITADGAQRRAAVAASFKTGFAAGSSRSSIANGYRYVIAWDAPGWPSTTAELLVEAMNAHGLLASATWTATISNPPAPPDVTAPVVTFSPPGGPGSPPIAVGQPLSIHVVDAVLLRRVVIAVRYPSGLDERVWTGYAFTPFFAAGSSVTGTVATGLTFIVARTGGWPGAPTPEVVALDAAGNEA